MITPSRIGVTVLAMCLGLAACSTPHPGSPTADKPTVDAPTSSRSAERPAVPRVHNPLDVHPRPVKGGPHPAPQNGDRVAECGKPCTHPLVASRSGTVSQVSIVGQALKQFGLRRYRAIPPRSTPRSTAGIVPARSPDIAPAFCIIQCLQHPQIAGDVSWQGCDAVRCDSSRGLDIGRGIALHHRSQSHPVSRTATARSSDPAHPVVGQHPQRAFARPRCRGTGLRGRARAGGGHG